VHDLFNHDEIKPEIMKGIQEMGTHSLVEEGQRISNTDWHLGPRYKRPYGNYVLDITQIHIEMVKEIINIPGDTITMGNYWFQQYAEGDYHDWHLHANATFSNVYYVDLPDGASKTSFRAGEITFEVPVKEGQILTFPACFAHCSKPNPVGVKTIISFNY
jgi:hypothetical protein